jgi:hypothetical protein
VTLAARLALALVPRLAAWLIRLLHATIRVRHVGRGALDGIEARGERYIHAFWHGRLLLMPYSYRGSRITILVSEHRDGEYISRTMERFGFHTTRGSTTRGGARALRAAVRRMREGYDLGITPDGPRGPRQRVQPGVIEAARLSGAPIVPVTFSAHPAWEAGSWDGFQVPWPFARGVFLYGEPLSVPRGAGAGECEEARRRLEEAMIEQTRRADRLAASASLDFSGPTS